MKQQQFQTGNHDLKSSSSRAEEHRQDQGTSCLHFDSTDLDFAQIQAAHRPLFG
jgi:hypothetical protein